MMLSDPVVSVLEPPIPLVPVPALVKVTAVTPVGVMLGPLRVMLMHPLVMMLVPRRYS